MAVVLLNNQGAFKGYCHIDFDGERHWLGIFLAEEIQGEKVGLILIEYMEQHSLVKDISEIYLTVHPKNTYALKLYRSLGFYLDEDFGTLLQMKKNNSISSRRKQPKN